MCSGILRTEFGRRPSHAVRNAIVILAAEEAANGARIRPGSQRQVALECNQINSAAAIHSHPPRAGDGLAVRPASWAQRLRDWFSGFEMRPGHAFAAALAVLVAMLAVWFVWPDWVAGIKRAHTKALPMCMLSDALGEHWGLKSAKPKVGDTLSKGAFRLESGVVELTFASKTRVAVEGPAEFKLTGDNSMDLQAGKI